MNTDQEAQPRMDIAADFSDAHTDGQDCPSYGVTALTIRGRMSCNFGLANRQPIMPEPTPTPDRSHWTVNQTTLQEAKDGRPPGGPEDWLKMM